MFINLFFKFTLFEWYTDELIYDLIDHKLIELAYYKVTITSL